MSVEMPVPLQSGPTRRPSTADSDETICNIRPSKVGARIKSTVPQPERMSVWSSSFWLPLRLPLCY